MKSFIVAKEEENQTLEKYVKKVLIDAPLSFIYRLFRKKDVKVNGHWEGSKYIIKENDEIKIYITEEQLEDFKAKKEIKLSEDISSWIIYEDNNILLINKPRGILVQKDDANSKALDEMVLFYLSNKGEYDATKAYRPAPAHRLDRNTSGIVIFGKNLQSLQLLSEAMSDKNSINKEYLALVKGHFIEKSGRISLPLKKLTNNRVIVDKKEGKNAITLYEVVEEYGEEYTLLRINLLTGRTHQIRVHLAYISHPVIGDSKYGDYSLNKMIEEKYNFKNQFLSAHKLTFKNLKGQLEYLNDKSFEVKLDDEYIDLLKSLSHNS